MTTKLESNIIFKDNGDGTFTATTPNSKYVIEYDRNKCIGAASCAAIAPLTFFMDDENKARIITDGNSLDEDEVIMAGAQSCPVFAIRIIEKATGKILFPVEEIE